MPSMSFFYNHLKFYRELLLRFPSNKNLLKSFILVFFGLFRDFVYSKYYVFEISKILPFFQLKEYEIDP